MPVLDLVVLCVYRAGPVKVDFGAWANPSHGDQPEWRRL